MYKLIIPMLFCLIAAFPSSGLSGEVILRFDEVPFQPVDGLVVQGAEFDFKINGLDSSEAFYNSFGPGTLNFVDDPTLTGDSRGILTIAFAIPTSQLSFAVALNTSASLNPGFEVELFDSSHQSLGTTGVMTSSGLPALGFSEGPFAYSGTPVSRAVINFADQPGSFALDNLTYIVPEPRALPLAVFAVFCVALASNTRCATLGSRFTRQIEASFK